MNVLYGNATPLLDMEQPVFACHGCTPIASAFALDGGSGMAIYRVATGFYKQRRVTYVRSLSLATPFGPKLPGTEYANEGADATMYRPAPGPDLVIHGTAVRRSP